MSELHRNHHDPPQRNVRRRFCTRTLFFFAAFVIGYAPYIQPVFAASYALSPASGSYSVGSTFSVKVMINSGTDAVNTGDATLTFDIAKLTAVSVSKDGSPFNLWVTEPAISGGTIAFAGGGTMPVSGSKAVITITFKAKAEGTADVKFSKGTLLAGAGQNVLSGSTNASFTITPATDEPASAPDKPERTVNIPPPDAPVIESKTHEDQELWYKETSAKFSWDIPYGVTGLLLLFDNQPESQPTGLHEPPISEWSEAGLKDGVWYLHASYKNRGGWSSTTHYRVKIDSTPPEEFTASATGGDLTAQIRFEAKDALSGIALYRVGIDGGRTRDVQQSELLNGGYTITNLDPGDHTITVIAVDQASNERETSTTVTVTGTKPVEEEGVQTSGLGLIYWVSLLFMAALAVAITMLIQERRKFHEEKDQIKRETAEAGDKLINIFGVLRDEMEEKVLELSHKPNMTDNERQILEGLKDALDISEELIDKEIEDVRKLLK